MKRLVAITVLTGWCVLAAGTPCPAQTLKERSLSDTPAPAKASPAPQQTPPAPTSLGVEPAPQAPQSAPPAGSQSSAPPPAGYQPPSAGTQAPPPAGYQPSPPPPGNQPPPPAGYQPPPPRTGTMVNGQPVGTQPPAYENQSPPAGYQPPPPPPAPGGGTLINGQPIGTPPPPPPPMPTKPGPYNRDEVNREVMGYFEGGSRGLAELVARAFRDLGQPTGFIKGNEGGGALLVGFRYGTGSLHLKGYPPLPIYWQSPSLGFDLGINAGKVFTLVYGMTRPEQIFQRFPGVDGSAYILGGFGMNYQRSGNITLAPIRVGVGLRLGAALGYQVYTRDQEVNPF